MMKLNLDIKLEDLTQILPHLPLLSSKQANWDNIFLAYYDHPGVEICEHNFQQHVLEIIDPNSWSYHERRMGDKLLSYRIGGGEICWCPGGTSHWTSWEEPLCFTVLAFDPQFFARVAHETVDGDRLEMVPKWKIFDPLIQQMVTALKSDLEAGCPAGRLYGESFGTALAVHLLKNFSGSPQKIPEYSDGLAC